jgi:hypothetical protein
MTGDGLARATAAAVLLVAAIAAVVSFVHIEHLAVTHGQTELAAYLLPVSVDGTVAAASLVMLRAARAGLGTPVLARTMLGLAVSATLAANVAYGVPYGITGALLSGWPAVAFIGCAEMAIGMIRRTRAQMYGSTSVQPAPGTEMHPRTAVPAEARPFAAELARGEVPSIRRIRSELHVGQPRAREIQARLEALTPAGQRIRRIRHEIRQGAPVPEDSPAGVHPNGSPRSK